MFIRVLLNEGTESSRGLLAYKPKWKEVAGPVWDCVMNQTRLIRQSLLPLQSSSCEQTPSKPL